jgi:hypothetical protein
MATKKATSTHRTIKLPAKSKGSVTRSQMREAVQSVLRERASGRFVKARSKKK